MTCVEPDCMEASRTARAKRCPEHHAARRRGSMREANNRYAQRHPERVKANNDKQNARNRDSGYHAQWQREVGYWRAAEQKYGISRHEHERMLERQGGKCAICGAPDSCKGTDRLLVDHDHRTGKVRGLLCSPCNTVLGLVDDESGRLVSAAAYLMQHVNLLERVCSG
jgi:hypothetical protein